MVIERAVQPSLWPELAPDKPFGPIIGSVFVGTNAELIAAIGPLYLTGSVCDLTYGKGGWWKRYQPDVFVAHDIDPTKGDGVDFRHLPEPDDTYDAVTFDPPYIAQGGDKDQRGADFRDRFGLVQRSTNGMWRMIGAGLIEAARVTKPGGFVVTKCMDAVSGQLDLGHVRMITIGQVIGLGVHDLIVHHGGPGLGGHNIKMIQRARRHHSYLIAFRVRP
jgi:hypothetical protein